MRGSSWCLLHSAVKSVPVLCEIRHTYIYIVLRSSVVAVVIVNYIEDPMGNMVSSSVTSCSLCLCVCDVCSVCVCVCV